jgi:hypothetical protein
MTALLDTLVTLAGTPDDDPAVETHLCAIARLAPAAVATVDSASVTVPREGRYVTLVSSDERAVAVDLAQYRDGAGPCLQALHDQRPAAVPQADAKVEWPQFREQAMAAGLFAALSIPLYAGSGTTVASLNLYARRPEALSGLIVAVLDLYGSDPAATSARRRQVGDGAEDLLDALAAALRVYDDIQHALGMLMARRNLTPADAYTALLEAARARHRALHAAALEHLAHADT